MAKSGVKKSVAKAAYNNVKTDLANLEAHMNSLVTHVEQMNASYWYGSDTANSWYTTMRKHYCANKANLVKFYTGVANFQTSLHSQFAKSSQSKISF